MDSTIVRDYSLDVLKGILILLVIIGHSLQRLPDCWHNVFFTFIYSFHMPLFVMISGYFFKSSIKRTYKEVICVRTKRLLLPWFIWSTYLFCVFILINSFNNEHHSILWYVKEIYRVYVYIWYLLCIFILSIFYYPICYALKTKKNIWIFFAVCLIAIWVLSLLYYDKIPAFCLKKVQLTRQTLIFGVGILWGLYYKNFSLSFKLFMVVISCIVICYNKLMVGFWFDSYSLYQRIGDGMACSILMFFVLKYLSTVLSKGPILNFFVYLGNNSLIFYVVHVAIIYTMNKLNLTPVDLNYSYCFIYFIFLFGSTIIITELLRKIFHNTYKLGF